MSPQCIGYIVGIIVLTALSSFFSASETAYNSLNKIKLKNQANEGSKRAKKALLLVDNYDKLITTILIGNNIVNIAAATIATLFFTEVIKSQPDLAATISTIVVTIVTLIFGEITPKTIAKEFSEGFATRVATILQILCLIFTPFTWLFSKWQKIMIKIFKPKNNTGMSEAELITMVDEATTEGGIDKDEGELIRSAIEFNELTVKDIFTPRVDVIAVEVNAKKDELRDLFLENGFSRLPVYEEDIDNVVGVLHEKDFYKNYFKKEFEIKKYMTQTIWVTLTANLSSVLKMLQKSKAHMAVVLDEYGGTAGIV
ncbi:MAG: hemolysin family protein, partial [Clostridia bacterium]|nr:hemolysin family protein [Clostridia bacterium]